MEHLNSRLILFVATLFMVTSFIGTGQADDSAGVRKWDARRLAGEIQDGGHLLFLQSVADGMNSSSKLNTTTTSEDCKSSSALTTDQRQMAIAIGKGLQSRNVPIYSVRSASTCDAIATAEALGVGSVQIEESLNPIPSNTDNATDIAKLKQSVTIDIPDGSNILMVTFGSNINRLINAKISNPSGTLHAFHKTESGLAYVGSIAPDEWQK